MNCDYLLFYGEGKQENRFQFHGATLEEAVQTAKARGCVK